MSQLDAGAIHAWCRQTNASEYERYRAVLSDDELARCDRFHFARDRHDYANAHHLLRTTLSRHDATPPAAWRFEAGSHGKPALVSEHGEAPLRFNLSHTRHIVACVLSRGAAVGIDIERADRLRDAMTIADRFFSPREVANLRACVSDMDRERRFIELWTLKEAFLKATGKGLSQPLDAFTFDVNEDDVIRSVPPPDVGSSWRFAQYELARDVITAIAVRGGASSPLRLRLLIGEAEVEIAPRRASNVNA